MKFDGNSSSGRRADTCGQTDGYDELYKHFLRHMKEKNKPEYRTTLLLLLSLWGPSAYASGSTSALWLIVLSPVLDFPTFSNSYALPRPISREGWSFNPVI
jgi:hypothetical protein